MEITQYAGKETEGKGDVIQKEEYGTIVEKEKKKKKKKNKAHEHRSREIDEDKIKQMARESELHAVLELNQEEKVRYSEAEIHPLKIICANLPFKITAEQIFQYFNTLISTSNPELASPPPIKNVEFDRAKTFAILTVSSRRIKDFFRSHPEVAYVEGTTTFRMVKPKQFFEERYLKKIETSKGGEDNRIYLGGLPSSFMDDQVRKICETFGKLKFFNLAKDGKVSKGYCFFQYEVHKDAEKAVKALNGFPIGNQRLKCHQANYGNKGLSLSLTPAATIMQEKPTKPANHTFGSYLLSYENITNPEIQATLVSDPLCKIASRVIQFLNMCYPEDLYDSEFLEDLEEDVRQECQKYGTVQKIEIPKPFPTCGYAVPSVGKVFVKFMYITHSRKARLNITGRVYNKRTVVVSFYPEEKFNAKEYLVKI